MGKKEAAFPLKYGEDETSPVAVISWQVVCMQMSVWMCLYMQQGTVSASG